MNQLIETLELYFGKKAPQLPPKAREVLVKIAPYITILGILLLIPAILVLLGLGTMLPTMAPYASYGYAYNNVMIIAIFSIVLAVLYIIALPGLFHPSPKGWNFMFYATLVSALQNILMMNLLGLVIGLVISFYILFQIRPHYFGMASPVTPPVPPSNPQI